MDRQSTKTLRRWIRHLPPAKINYPETVWNRVKYGLWRVYTPVHPLVRDSVTLFRRRHSHNRHKYLLGKIAPGISFQDFISYLIGKGFGNHFIAWRDQGEIVSLRYVERRNYQYHLRIFIDREVRGHYEFTPESKPIRHLREVGIEPRREYFLEVLGEWITEEEE